MSLSKEFPEDLDFSPSRKLLKLCKSDGVLGFHCHFQIRISEVNPVREEETYDVDCPLTESPAFAEVERKYALADFCSTKDTVSSMDDAQRIVLGQKENPHVVVALCGQHYPRLQCTLCGEMVALVDLLLHLCNHSKSGSNVLIQIGENLARDQVVVVIHLNVGPELEPIEGFVDEPSYQKFILPETLLMSKLFTLNANLGSLMDLLYANNRLVLETFFVKYTDQNYLRHIGNANASLLYKV